MICRGRGTGDVFVLCDGVLCLALCIVCMCVCCCVLVLFDVFCVVVMIFLCRSCIDIVFDIVFVV